jgi:hypothetical protein
VTEGDNVEILPDEDDLDVEFKQSEGLVILLQADFGHPDGGS